MLPPRSVTEDGLKFTAGWEGWVPRVYKDIVNVTTWGYGHARKGNEPLPDHELTKAEGLILLGSDMATHVAPLDIFAKDVDLPPECTNALGDWLFNCGAGALQHSGVLAALLRKDFAAVPGELAKWCKVMINGVKQTNQGLLNRRHAEGKYFLTGNPSEMLVCLGRGDGQCPSYRTHEICPPDEEIAARGVVILDDLTREGMERARKEARDKAFE